MPDIEEIKTRLANMRYNREYNELNRTERLIVDQKVEYELEYAAGI